jgi:AraC family transcriptional regulator
MSLSQLSKAAVSYSFDCNVKGSIQTPQATVELHDYRFYGRQVANFEPHASFLDLALSTRPGQAHGRYLDAPNAGNRRMGDVIFIPVGSRLHSEWGGGDQKSVCLEFDSDNGLAGEDWTSFELDASLDVRSPFVRNGLARLAREIEQPGFESALMAETICIQLRIDLGRYFRATRTNEDICSGKLSASQLRQIEDRLEAEGPRPSVADLALDCGVSTRHFFRMFRTTTGMTLSEFAIERRLSRAKSLLASRKHPIKQISWICGFETAAAFSAAFRKATGFRPREYQRLLSN